jgi:hypothetical protein
MSASIEQIAGQLNAASERHPIGQLQTIRQRLKGRRRERRPLFERGSIFERYAYHWGGREELQFNIGEEAVDGKKVLRHGVAFSFELSMNLPSIWPLVPKVARFNEFMRLYPDAYSDMRMWNFRDGQRSAESRPQPIPDDLVHEQNFVFLGSHTPRESIDVGRILDDFDRLLPLYEFVEGGAATSVPVLTAGSFVFRSGHMPKKHSTTANPVATRLDVSLRHNLLQTALFARLVARYGADNVGTETPSGIGTWIDAVVRVDAGYWFFEIKTGLSARACLREGLGQLLEYAFWPGAQEAQRLVVVGEAAFDDEAREYLQRLSARFELPLAYEQIVVA